MTSPKSLDQLTGLWAGDNRLWLMPEEPAHHSETVASIDLTAQGMFATIKYTWADGGKPQDGMLVIGVDKKQGAVDAFWVDSFHLGDKSMRFQGTLDGDGVISVRGTYPAPPGPDWGWRIVISPPTDDRFQMTMYNISPEGEEALAVEANYTRTS